MCFIAGSLCWSVIRFTDGSLLNPGLVLKDLKNILWEEISMENYACD